MKIKIAVADDQPIVRSGIVSLLNSRSDFEVIFQADNGLELSQAISDVKIQPDICILDIKMPKMNGYETAAFIKGKSPKTKVIALTMYNSELSILKMVQYGVEGYLLKDCSSEELFKAVQTVHNGSHYYSSEIYAGMANILDKSKIHSKQYISTNEFSFLTLCCSDLTYKQIASKMNLSLKTIDDYRDTLFKRFGLNSRLALMVYALNSGIEPLLVKGK